MASRLRNISKRVDKINKRIYYKNIEYPEIPVSTSDIYIVSKTTDRLDLLANDYYNDPKLWWIISKANPGKISRDSFFIDPGLQIRIPINVEQIQSNFVKLNKQ